jgi:2-dehydro-3-deoxyphosphooctonate aldolase (KDO 8-P synthase)
MGRTIKLGKIRIGAGAPLVLIAGPCVIENPAMAMKAAVSLKKITSRLKIPFVFKASYDKANRTSINSFRGPGLRKGLEILRRIKDEVGVPITSDVHEVSQVAEAAEVLDIIQIPAFLCRQTDLLTAVAQTGRIVNVKKGQFLAPWDVDSIIKKIEKCGNKNILLTERGSSFGYNNLVSDFRSLAIMRRTGYPVVYDVSHSVQKPGGLGTASGGDSTFIPLLARCGVAAGCDALFMEVHPNPAKALSDRPNMLPIGQLEKLLKDLIAIDKVVKKGSRGK